MTDYKKEMWKDIPKFEGRYKVSNLGRVLSLYDRGFRRDKIMSPAPDDSGYESVVLYKSGVRNRVKVYRLVLLAFVGPSNLVVHHKDGNRKNNCLDNLEYVTQKENTNYSIKAGRMKVRGEDNGNSKLKSDEVREIRDLYKIKKHTQTKLANIFSVSQSTINNIVSRTHWRHI